MAFVQLSKEIAELALDSEESWDRLSKKRDLKDRIDEYLQREMPDKIFKIHFTGSTVNGLAVKGTDSDLDLCVKFNSIYYNHWYATVTALRKCNFVSNFEAVSEAKVPVICFRDTETYIPVEMTVNCAESIRTTHLIKCYMGVAPLVKQLAMVLKIWTRKNGINSAREGTISSYVLCLMLINYLQIQEEPVVPNLQKLYPQEFSKTADVDYLIEPPEMFFWRSTNTKSVGELLLGFLQHYSQFDFGNTLISVELGKQVRKSEASLYDRSFYAKEWRYRVLIEDPCSRGNAGRSIFTTRKLPHIKAVFRRSYEKLSLTHNLNDILPVY